MIVLDSLNRTSIAVLGEGVTAAAVTKKLAELGIPNVSLDKADIIVTSPGIPPEKFQKADKPIISEIELAYLLFKTLGAAPALIGVTGTNGKTTVTSLIAHILDAPAAGNIGTPLIQYVGKTKPSDILVVELSSFQLEFCFQFLPDVAVLLPITPDHLDRHLTMENYALQKAKLVQNHTNNHTLIYQESDSWITYILKTCSPKSRRIGFSTHHPYFSKLTLPHFIGAHNKLNALASILAAEAMGVDADVSLKKCETFSLPSHRCEKIGSYHGRIFINDSKATTLDSTRAAIRAFEQPKHLILCGKDKATPESEMKEALSEIGNQCRSVVIFGDVADKLFRMIESHQIQGHFFRASSLRTAIEVLYSRSREGDVLLFSPGFTSFDLFKNFEHRGETFKEMVHALYSFQNEIQISN